MTSPAGVSEKGAVISTWQAVHNFTWMPINVHRIIANVAFGGSIAAAYAAVKFLQAKTDEERAHYDWMGYIGNFVAISAFLPLPFAGYWLAKEIYAYSQTLGLTMMGGAFSWLFIIQAVLIGNLFLGANYYLWLGMGRVAGAQNFQKYIKYLLDRGRRSASWSGRRRGRSSRPVSRSARWAAGPPGARIPGRHVGEEHRGQHPDPDHLHELPALPAHRARRPTGRLGQDRKRRSARNLRDGRGDRRRLGILGYFVEAKVRIGLSVPQVGSVLLAMIAITRDRHPALRARPPMSGEVPLGRDPRGLAVRPDLHRGHLHLA